MQDAAVVLASSSLRWSQSPFYEQAEQESLRLDASAKEADKRKLQQALEEQAADHEAHSQSLSSTSEQALKRLSEEHIMKLAQISAEHQAALDEASRRLATSQVQM